MRQRFVAAAVVAVSIVVLSAAPAMAGERPGGDGGAFVDPNGDPTATAGDGGSGGGGGGSGGGGATDDPCEWHVVIEDDFEFGIYDVDSLETQHSATGRWLERWCPGIGAVDVNGYFLIPEGGLVDPYQLALDALASVGIAPPAIRTSPSENGRLYVQVPTWLWLDRSWWQSYEATANAGRVWSTVKATPVATTWQLGDGGSVSCRGPGTAWRAGLPEDSSDCTHTYRTSSAGEPDGRFMLQATVTLEVTWTSNATGGGTLPAISRASTLEVDVGEIQAIGTGGGR
jgi:hypothetical protein